MEDRIYNITILYIVSAMEDRINLDAIMRGTPLEEKFSAKYQDR